MKRLLLLAGIAVIAVSAFAQNRDNKWNFGLSYGTSQYAGDVENGFLDFNAYALENNGIGSIYLSRYLSRSFDLTFVGTYGALGYYKNEQYWKAEFINIHPEFRYKFANGYLIEENSVIRPYLLFGAGIDRFKGPSHQTNEGWNGSVNAGAGINLMLTDNIAVFYQGTFGYMTDDSRDRLEQGAMNDSYLLHAVGLSFNIGKAKDSDNDGVPDKTDKCPTTPAMVKVDADGCPVDGDSDGIADYLDKCPGAAGVAATSGCPDKDKDGVSDEEDQCPDLIGTVALKGCPDTDNDGIIDTKDKCPNVKGVIAFEGCPDTDNDGIQDDMDKCPEVAGVKAFDGCPDKDADGIEDSKDACPDKKGPVETKGCPDTDQDGIHDGIDKCPTIKGVASAEGCPELQKDVKQLFQKALQGIQFETGKATIKPVSFPILDAVVKVMKDNPTYNLIIEGHTDNVGSDDINMTLSQNRAESVAKYLIEKGVSPTRLTARGYGESKPVDTNNTNGGRFRNRRVELKVEFVQ